MLSDLEEWGGYCGRVAEALLTRYDLPEQAVGFFRFFAGSPPGFTEQATSVVASGLAAGEGSAGGGAGGPGPACLRDRVLGRARRRPWPMR
jgi:hypothetical protein